MEAKVEWGIQAKLSDQQLYQLYVGLGVHYKECCERNPKLSDNDIALQLWTGVRASLEARYGINTLNQLSPDEKMKAYKVLDTFIEASPLFRSAPAERDVFTAYLNALPPRNVTIIVNDYRGKRHFSDNSFLTGYMYGSMYRPWYRPSWWGPGAGHHNSHSHHHDEKKDNSALAMLALILLVAAAAASAIIATYYLVHEIANSMDRFWHNEGWLRAGVSLMGMAVGGLATSLLTTAFAAGPLTSLAIAAGIASPVGVVAFSIACFSILGAAAGSWLVNAIQSRMIENNNADALYPADPSRFALSASEEQVLVTKGIDPIKVKCGIAELRKRMGPVPNLDVLDGDARAKKYLDIIRQLRKGERSTLDLDEMSFDFSQTPDPVAFVCEPPPPPSYVSEPSAPISKDAQRAPADSSFFGGGRALRVLPTAPYAPLPNDDIFGSDVSKGRMW